MFIQMEDKVLNSTVEFIGIISVEKYVYKLAA